MSTYLQICQEINRLSGLQGTFDSVSSATGYQANIAAIASKAWTDIQNQKHDWDFLRTSRQFQTVVGQTEYTISDIFGTSVSPVGSWIPGKILYEKAADNRVRLRQYDFDYYDNRSLSQGQATEPSFYAVDPVDLHLYTNNIDGIYTITANYHKKPVVLVNNGDVPEAPSEFHTAIIYRGVADFTFSIGNMDLYELYSQKASSIMGSLMRATVPSRKIITAGIA
ncbi:MAG: hypothetical protein KAS32_25200 [Candidatus Peribacteraceae bacterium]|nr:hypothetical protein [Candidatus Peribacteraceae bacterium]